MKDKKFINGFASWQETHFEMVRYIVEDLERYPGGYANKIVCNHGTGSLYQIAEDWTDEFETLYKDKFWDGDFWDCVELFVNNKIK